MAVGAMFGGRGAASWISKEKLSIFRVAEQYARWLYSRCVLV